MKSVRSTGHTASSYTLVHEAIKILNRAKGGVPSVAAGSYQAAGELVPLGWCSNDYNNKQAQFALRVLIAWV